MLEGNGIMTGFALIIRFWREAAIGLLALIIGGLILLNARIAAERNAAEARVQSEEAKHAVTTASLRGVTGKLRETTAAVNALAKADADRIAASKAALARADEANKARQRTIDALLASASTNQPGPPCEPSAAVKEAWK